MNVSSDPLSKKEHAGWQISFGQHAVALKLKKDKIAVHPVTGMRVTYTSLGLLAIGLGIFAWTRKEHTRIAGGAAALGLIAVAWQWVLIGVCVAVVLLLLACFSA